MSRPSSKAIYMHRKEYSNSLSSEPACLQHRVEHLMTCKLGTQGVQDPKDAVKKLQEVDAQGRVWSQNLFLQVRDGWLQLLDIETKEELDSYRLDSIQAVDVAPSSRSYDNVLAITVQEPGPPGSSTLLFQCQEVGAQRLRTSLQKALEEEREGRPPLGALHQGQDRWQGTPQEWPLPREQAPALEQGLPPEQPRWMAREHNAQPSPRPLSRHSSAREPRAILLPPPRRPPSPRDPTRDQEVLNRILADIELFMGWLREAQANTTPKRKNTLGKKKDKYRGGVTQAQYIDCFQKFKYSFNLLGKLAPYMQNPSPDHLLHLLFNTLNLVLTKCPERGLAAQVTSPLLTPEAVDLMQLYLSPPESSLWKSLGVAWTTSRDKWTGKEPPPYQPTFYDGWQIPEPSDQAPLGYQDSTSFQPVQQAPRMQVIHDFEARNPKELTVAQGEVVEVLDDSRQWWLVKSKTGESGYIPSNVLEALESGDPGSQSQSPPWTPVLRLSSRPEEVRAWLQAENFSTLTVKTLGFLMGSQLLHLKPGELQMLCPQEAPRILARLEAVRRTLGVKVPWGPNSQWKLGCSLGDDNPLGSNTDISKTEASSQQDGGRPENSSFRSPVRSQPHTSLPQQGGQASPEAGRALTSPLAVLGALSSYHLFIVPVLSLEPSWLDSAGFRLVRLLPNKSIFISSASSAASSGLDGGQRQGGRRSWHTGA